MYVHPFDQQRYPRLEPLVRDLCLWLQSISFAERFRAYHVKLTAQDIDMAAERSIIYGPPPRIVIGTFPGKDGMAIPDVVRNLDYAKLRISTRLITKLHSLSFEKELEIYKTANEIFFVLIHELTHCLRWYTKISSVMHMLTRAEERENIQAINELLGISLGLSKEKQHLLNEAYDTKSSIESLRVDEKIKSGHLKEINKVIAGINRLREDAYSQYVPNALNLKWTKASKHLKARLEYEKLEDTKTSNPYDYRNK